jgi:hypothetical protein
MVKRIDQIGAGPWQLSLAQDRVSSITKAWLFSLFGKGSVVKIWELNKRKQ